MITERAGRYLPSVLGPPLLAAFAVALMSSCADLRAPEYQRPDSPTKSSWSRESVTGVLASDAISPDWWQEFRDPYLDTLVSRALQANFDLKILAARVQVAGAQIDEVRAGALPVVDVGAGASFEKNTGLKSTKQFNVAAQVNWEIDIWGKVEKGVQAQTAEYRASEADWRAGYLTLVSAVSTTYFQILQFDDQIDRQQETLDRNNRILAIYEAQFKNGLASQTQVLRQAAESNRLTNELLDLRRLRDLSENALATLLGVPAGELKAPRGHLQERVQLPAVPFALPSQLLSRRPDIVAAEYRVLEAYDLVGQARLAQLPTLGLTARGGTSSLATPSNLFKSFTLSFLPSINLPVFDPSIRAHVKTTEAQIKVSQEEYRRTVIAAFEEVENTLVNLDAHKKQRLELEQETDRLRTVAAQVGVQLKEGIVSQLEVLETERSLLAAQLALLGNHQQLLSDTVLLYKALGGGWPTVDILGEVKR